MSDFQHKAAAYVKAHGHFATPAADGGVFVWIYAVGPQGLTIIREHASTGRELRAVLGY